MLRSCGSLHWARAHVACGGARAAPHPKPQPLAPAPLILFGVRDESKHVARGYVLVGCAVAPVQLGVRRELAAFVELPHLLSEGRRLPARNELGDETMQVVDVAQQQLARVAVAGGVDRLREVDDDRAVRAHQHVEVREVAVHDAGRQHSHHLGQQAIEDGGRAAPVQAQVAQARRWVAVGVRDQFHDQHAIDEVVGRGHAHAGGAQPVDHVDLGRAPGGFVLLAAVARALLHRALVATVAHVAAFGVLGALLEAAMLRVLVDLGDAQLRPRTHEIDLCFFAAHQRPHDLVHDAFIDEGQERGRSSHVVWEPVGQRPSRR